MTSGQRGGPITTDVNCERSRLPLCHFVGAAAYGSRLKAGTT